MKASEFLRVIPTELQPSALKVLDPVPSMRGVLISHPLSDQVYRYRVFTVQRLSQYFEGSINFETIICAEATLQQEIAESVQAVELKTPIDAEDFRRLTYYHKNSTLFFEEFKRFVLTQQGQVRFTSHQLVLAEQSKSLPPLIDSRSA